MKIFDFDSLLALSDLFINLSAGWLGAAFITPNFSKKKGIEKIMTLIFDLILAIFCLVTAIYIKKIK